MYLFDTNVFLEILLGQEKSAAAKKAVGMMTENKRGTVTSFSIHAIEAIIGANSKRLPILKEFLTYVWEHPFLDRYATTTQEEIEIAGLSKTVGLDFDDALQYYVSRKLNLTLITFDKHFINIDGIRVVFP